MCTLVCVSEKVCVAGRGLRFVSHFWLNKGENCIPDEKSELRMDRFRQEEDKDVGGREARVVNDNSAAPTREVFFFPLLDHSYICLCQCFFPPSVESLRVCLALEGGHVYPAWCLSCHRGSHASGQPADALDLASASPPDTPHHTR